MITELPCATCGCEGPPDSVRGLPVSTACHSGTCGGCTGFEDGHATLMCGHRCHWCPSGMHLRERVPRP